VNVASRIVEQSNAPRDDFTPSSWPGLSRPSTSLVKKKDVDARPKAGHDELIRKVGKGAPSRRAHR
jgi:hypothetical protein